jgi:hypothetical protein
LRSYLLLGLLVLFVGSLLAGCQSATTKPGSLFPYQQVSFNEAPAELQAAGHRTGMVPGLYVLTTEAETYLLVQAGKVEQSGMKLVVTDVRRMGNVIRVMAVVRPGPDGDSFPAALVKFPVQKGLQFKARISMQSEEITELDGIPIETE